MRRPGSVKAQALAVIEARGALTSTEVLAAIQDLTGRVVPRETLIPELSRMRAAKCIDYHNGRWTFPRQRQVIETWREAYIKATGSDQ